jgi:hypothetical protein
LQALQVAGWWFQMIKYLRLAFMLAVIICGFLFITCTEFGAAQYNSSISYSQIISSNTIWARVNSPINLKGNVFVQEGVTLTIEAGVTVNFQRYLIQINGTLKVLGTEDSNVLFTNANPQIEDVHDQLAGIVFGDTSTNNDIEYTIFPTMAVSYFNCQSPLTLNHVNFDNGATNIPNGYMSVLPIIRGSAHVTITNCHFTSGLQIYCPSDIINNTFIGAGVDAENGDFLFQNNTILGERSPVEGFGLSITRYTNNARSIISDNYIYGFNEACIKIDGPALIQRNLLQSPPNRAGYPFFGIEVDGSSPTIQNNTITNCGIGICIYDQGIEETKPTIKNNNLNDNTNGNLYLGYPKRPGYNPSDYTVVSTINAAENWWGTNDSAKISQTIHDKNEQSTLSTVNFIPFLTLPNPQATPNMALSKPTVQQIPPNYYMQATESNGAKIDLTFNGDLVVYSNAPINITNQGGTTQVNILVRADLDQVKFINITVPKSAVLDGSTPQISFENKFTNQQVQTQGYNQDANNYYVWATTNFSSYYFGNLRITFTNASNDYTTIILIATIAVFAVIFTVMGILWHKRKKA